MSTVHLAFFVGARVGGWSYVTMFVAFWRSGWHGLVVVWFCVTMFVVFEEGRQELVPLGGLTCHYLSLLRRDGNCYEEKWKKDCK